MSAAWVKTALPPLLGPLPGWVVIPVPYMLLSMSKHSVLVFFITLAVAIFLTSKGRNLLWVLRRTKSFFRGGRIESRPLGYRRRLTALVHVSYFEFNRWRKS